VACDNFCSMNFNLSSECVMFFIVGLGLFDINSHFFCCYFAERLIIFSNKEIRYKSKLGAM
jgi:hypothetical protein